MEEEDDMIVKWAQEDVETSYSLLNKNAGDDRHLCRSIKRYSFVSRIIGAGFLSTRQRFQQEGATPHTENFVLDTRHDDFRPKMI